MAASGEVTLKQTSQMTPLERVVEVEAICTLKSRRDHAVDRKDWATYAALHSHDYRALSIREGEEIVGGQAAADVLAVQMEGMTSVHHCHTPVIEFQDRNHATGVWAMEDNLFWKINGEKQWLRGYGFYHEKYVRESDGQWRFAYRKLVRLHVETSPGASQLADDRSGKNPLCARK